MTTPNGTQIVHGSCVAFKGSALLILGPSGSGKSSLSLQLMALGAQLVADDQTILTRVGDQLIASCPASIAGLVEARGVGILNADIAPATKLSFVVDLGKTESDRIPVLRSVTILGCETPLLYGSQSLHFASALMQLNRAGRSDR